jgi:hypothetical protein
MDEIKELLILVKDKETGETKKVGFDVYLVNTQKFDLIDMVVE